MEVAILVGIICAIICALMAEPRGRNKSGWAIGGFFFGILAILILAIAGKTNEKILEERSN
jgi:VIT1/CCC1 family predicted Fe2+/Mn2+ transporter